MSHTATTAMMFVVLAPILVLWCSGARWLIGG